MLFRRHRFDPRLFRLAVGLLYEARHVVALTGAGISTPSGIPDFRSAHSGLWSRLNPLEVASLWGFRERPERFYAWMGPLARSIAAARPNGAHQALAQLQQLGKLRTLITQNIDALHQRVGCNCVIELHGHLRTATCIFCGYRTEAEAHLRRFIATGALPRCPDCMAVLKPDVVLFGEPLPEPAILSAQEETLRCDLMIVIGSSLEVMPAADLPALAVRAGARLIIVNMSPTPYDHLADVVLRGNVASVLPRLVTALQKRSQARKA